MEEASDKLTADCVTVLVVHITLDQRFQASRNRNNNNNNNNNLIYIAPACRMTSRKYV